MLKYPFHHQGTCNHELTGLYEALSFVRAYHLDDNISFPFLGVVGATDTSVTHPVAATLQVFGFPLISYASSDAALSNNDLYEYFLRTFPSNNLQTNAMVDLVLHFGWEYVRSFSITFFVHTPDKIPFYYKLHAWL